jgi:hypothetical protein
MKMMVVLHDSVKSMANRFDQFQGSIEAKVNRLEGEMILLKNKVNIMESRNNAVVF